MPTAVRRKNRIGIAIPLSIPNSDRARSLERVNLVRQFGTSRFSTVRREVLKSPGRNGNGYGKQSTQYAGLTAVLVSGLSEIRLRSPR